MNSLTALDATLRKAVSAVAEDFLATIPSAPTERKAAFFLGPYGIRLRFSSFELERELLPQFGHVIEQSEVPPDLTIYAAELTKQLNGIELVWGRLGLPQAHTSTSIRQGAVTIHVEFDEGGLASLFVLDTHKSIAVFAAASAARIKPLEGTYPFLLILRLWSERTPYLWTHGAAVGDDRAGVLITGMGGAGKSSTSISVVGGKLSLLSDDHVLIGPDLVASSVYSTLRVRPDMIERLQVAESWFGGKWFDWRGKPSQILEPDQYRFLCRSLPLKAIVIPKHHCEDGPSFHRVSSAPALRAIAPVTITRHYVNPAGRLELLAAIVQSLPVYEFHTTLDLAKMREPFEHFVENLQRQ